MSVGQLLTRTFTPKDTHTLSGELIVGFTGHGEGDKECIRRAMASSCLLEYPAPCFTCGAADVILPAEANANLRRYLLTNWRGRPNTPGPDVPLDDRLVSYVASLAKNQRRLAGIHVPEVRLWACHRSFLSRCMAKVHAESSSFVHAGRTQSAQVVDVFGEVNRFRPSTH